MRIFKYVLFILLIFIIGAAIYIAVQPNEYSFSRSKIIEAPAAVVYNKVNDYEAWSDFSPWLEQEPDAKLTYNDITVGQDAGYSWEGKILGKGSMKTIDADPYESIDQKIFFVEPFESESNIKWTFEPVENGTKVTWAMEGKQDFMTKAFTAFMGPIEKTTGPDFERGLFKLDSLSTEEIKKYDIEVNGVTEHSGGYYLYATTSSKINDLEKSMPQNINKIMGYVENNNVSKAGPWFVKYHNWDTENNAVMYSVCVPTTAKVISNKDDILTGQLEPFLALKTTLKGNYNHLQDAWSMAINHINNDPSLEQTQTGPQLEVYVKGPDVTPNPAEWLTEIYLAINQL